MRKKIDPRVRTLIENAPKSRHRSMFVIVGDRGRDQVVNLYHILAKSVIKERPSVLWCYKKELGFSSHKKKRMKHIQSMIKKGLHDPDTENPFDLFISTTEIRYTYYKETHKILGNTFGMCVLQDFEAVTPNLLARTIETVEGGGLIILLLKNMSSLRQFYAMTMDVHARLRTENHQDIVGRFNERFMLSLSTCDNCLVLDDELNVLPVSSHIQAIAPLATTKNTTQAEQELEQLKMSLKDTEPIGSIINQARTLDQAKAILSFVEAVSEKTLRSTVSLTAGRGRGKSAALGLAISAAIAFGYSNIFVTSPSPENLKTLFEFLFKGLDALQYKEHSDYEIIQSTNPEFNKAIVRVNIFKSQRQTVQYIQPHDSIKLGQAELVVIDEAAAIPLPLVKNLLGPYLVFLASTINGYEGTGRSLSLKLINQLREQSGQSTVENNQPQKTDGQATTGRTLKEVELKEPIRYANGDPIEKWLNSLLCLDSATQISLTPTSKNYPHPSQCELYYVNRDTLFSFHKASELFLQQLVGLFVSSHYKNSPDDLLLMSDAPAHHIFVLLGPVFADDKRAVPDILCAVQVAMEGELRKSSVLANLAQGKAPAGDLIPWTISQQFQDHDFPSLSGARVVRIATHPNYQRMHYGSRALELLCSYYQGEITNLDESNDESEDGTKQTEMQGNLLTEDVKPRSNLPPLLTNIAERKCERLHYLGVSYGITPQLFGFWRRSNFIPVYLRQTQNELTGEHTCIMLKSLKSDDLTISCSRTWLNQFGQDFAVRFCNLLSFSFQDFAPALGLSVLQSCFNYKTESQTDGSEEQAKEDIKPFTATELGCFYTPYDLKRLDSYSSNLVDYHVVLDLIPRLSTLYFTRKLSGVSLSPVQSAILLAIGLQHKSIEKASEDLRLPVNQSLALFNKCVRKISNHLKSIQEKSAELSVPTQVQLTPIQQSLEDDLNNDSNIPVDNRSLAPYAINKDFSKALKGKSVPSMVSVKSDQSKQPFQQDNKRKSSQNNHNFAKKKKFNK